jgi:NAD dependent epimerase/dehydratase
MSSLYKNILVTGADGFIGSHLTEMLLGQGHRVRGLSYYNSFNDWGWLENVETSENLEVVCGDVRDPHFCKHIIKDVDLIFHLAALIAIPYSYVAPDSYVDTNVKGALNICQAARENGNIRMIHTSTSEVYGTAQYVPIDEKHPKQPQSPYSASKIGADAMMMSFYNTFELPVTIARPFNTYGPRQSARAIIPTIISQIVSGMKEIKLGDLSPTRDFNFVKDICRGFIALAKCDKAIGREVNIGSGTEISINELANLIINILGVDARVVSDDQRVRPKNSEVERLVCDSELLGQLTGWKPEVTIKKGIVNTIEWFKDENNLKKYKSEIYNI